MSVNLSDVSKQLDPRDAEIQRLRQQLAVAIEAEKATRDANVWLVDINRQLTDAIATARVETLRECIELCKEEARGWRDVGLNPQAAMGVLHTVKAIEALAAKGLG